MEVEKNQATKPWTFDCPMKELYYGIKNSANKKEYKFTNLQYKELSWNLLKLEVDEDEEKQRYTTLIEERWRRRNTLVRFFRERQLEARAAISVKCSHEQVGYEVNGVRVSVRLLDGTIMIGW